MKPGVLLIGAGLAELFIVDMLGATHGLFWAGLAAIALGLVLDIAQTGRENREALERMRLRESARRNREAA